MRRVDSLVLFIVPFRTIHLSIGLASFLKRRRKGLCWNFRRRWQIARVLLLSWFVVWLKRPVFRWSLTNISWPTLNPARICLCLPSSLAGLSVFDLNQHHHPLEGSLQRHTHKGLADITLGADSPFFSTIVLFHNRPFSLGFLERRILERMGKIPLESPTKLRTDASGVVLIDAPF